jgi:hypothetical protein
MWMRRPLPCSQRERRERERESRGRYQEKHNNTTIESVFFFPCCAHTPLYLLSEQKNTQPASVGKNANQFPRGGAAQQQKHPSGKRKRGGEQKKKHISISDKFQGYKKEKLNSTRARSIFFYLIQYIIILIQRVCGSSFDFTFGAQTKQVWSVESTCSRLAAVW